VAKKPFETLVGAVIERLGVFEPSFRGMLPKQSIFRIYRDTRFSHDKTPYKSHLSAGFSGPSRKSSETMFFPGYYLHLEFGNLMLGGGAYALDKVNLHKIRTAIAQDPDSFRELADAPAFRDKYPEGLLGERNKVLPAEFKATAASEPRIAQKQFYFMAEMDPETALRPDFADFVADYFRAGHDLNVYFRQIIGFQ
jgi:uncharacterized protein (TIGR02453 family)